MFERFAATAKSAVTAAVDEARERGDRSVGTEHLLLAVLRDGEGETLLGVRAADARAAADELDRRALAAVGVDLGTFRPTGPAPRRKSPRFGAGAKDVLARSLTLAMGARAKRIELRHLLLALLERDPRDPVADLFTALGVDTVEARARIFAS
ncbi:Clp protease N-terminal domain-containing protein [Glycomyces endophyticus]|uniref:Clp protease N-terminal domain-containing protein n=1 Tax=Glycomyces endophyticus TaxID=480996 RepID=A0ABP4T0P4_9ACTN